MINNDSVHRALASRERYAPAEDVVLAGFRDGVVRRRRHRQVGSMVGVAGAAAAVALGVVLIQPNRGGDQPTEQNGAAAPPTSTSVKIAEPPAPPALPFTVTGLPAGYQFDAWHVASTEAMAQYVGTKDLQAIVVSVSDTPRYSKQEGDTEEPTTIAGRPGTILRLQPDHAETQLHWQLADGRWVGVSGRVPTVSLTALRNVAENLSLQPTPLEVPFALTVLPDGYHVVNWTGGGQGPVGGSVMLCRSGVEMRDGVELPGDCLSVSTQEGTAPAATQTKAGTEIHEVPVDQQKVVNGVVTRATADGTLVYAQLDAGHWAQAFSKAAGVDLLRDVASTVGVR